MLLCFCLLDFDVILTFLFILFYHKHRRVGMLQYSLSQTDTELYQDLSTFIQIFRRTITIAELLSLTFEKGLPLSTSLGNAWTIIEEITQLSAKLVKKNGTEIEAITFGRFLYRLIEIIANCKIKYQYTSTIAHDQALQRFLKEAQTVARSGKESEGKASFLSIVNLTKLILLKYCNKVISSFDGGGPPVTGDYLEEIREKIKGQYVKAKQSQKISATRVFFLIANTEHEKEAEKSINEEKEPQKLFTNQTFSQIRKRYDKYAGMDLDFTFFRDSFFEAKSHYDVFYRNYLNRNSQCLSNIGSYHSEFQGYVKRRQQKVLRKDKGQRENINTLSDSLTIEAFESHEPSFRIEHAKPPPFADRNAISVSTASGRGKNHQDDSLKRFKVGNAKENIQSRDVSKKNAKLKHQILVSGSPNKNLENLAQENSLHIHHPSVMRVKTQTDKQKNQKVYHYSEQSPQHNSFRPTVSKGFLANVGKVSLKMRYFQMKYLPDVPGDHTIRSRMMLSHKFCIKHSTRNKSHNWLERKIDR